MSRFGDDLIRAMGEALAHAKGEGPAKPSDLGENYHCAASAELVLLRRPYDPRILSGSSQSLIGFATSLAFLYA